MDIYLHLWVQSCTDAGEGKEGYSSSGESIKAKVADT